MTPASFKVKHCCDWGRQLGNHFVLHAARKNDGCSGILQKLRRGVNERGEAEQCKGINKREEKKG